MEDRKIKSKIGHSLEQLEEGLILTLQDQHILNNGQINQNSDVLENYEKRKTNQAQHNQQIRKKLKTIANAATSHLEAKNQGLNGLLPHYDDYTYKNDEVDLEEGTVIKRSKPKLPKNVPNDFEQRNSISSQYYVSNKFKNRRVEKSSTGDLLNFLNETAEEKDEQAALQSAEDIIGESIDKVRKRRKLEKQWDQKTSRNVNLEDDELLAKVLKRTRQKNQDTVKVLDIIKEEHQEPEVKHDQNLVELQLNPISHQLPTLDRINDKKYEIKDAASGTTSCLFVNLPSQKLVHKQQEALPETFKEISPAQLQKMKEEVQFLEDRAIGVGMADTLKYLRENNLFHKQQQFGRTKDKDGEFNQPGDRVKLEYRNASGKLMKPKQAFRYMSSIFHGRGPGKNKVEKMKKKELIEMRMKQANSSNSSKLLTLLQKHQQKTGEAHMLINMGAKKKNEQ